MPARPLRLVPEEFSAGNDEKMVTLLTFVSHIGTIMAWAPQSSALLIIQCSDAGILTIGDTPDVEMAPTWKYMSLSSMFPCSVSTSIHYHNTSDSVKYPMTQSSLDLQIFCNLHPLPEALPFLPRSSRGIQAIDRHSGLHLS